MKNNYRESYTTVILDEEQTVSMAQLSVRCSLTAEQLIKFIDQGIIEPIDPQIPATRWEFYAVCVPRVLTARRLQEDLNINLAGAALALELLDEVKTLRQAVNRLQGKY
jgi:chaperone modulatory protein CbpM